MKKTLVALAAVLLSAAAFAQGTINFSTKVGSDPDFKFNLPDGQGAGADASARAQLILVGAGGSLTPLGTVANFRTTSAAAFPYINAGEIAVTGVAPGASATFRIRAWTGAATYEAAGAARAESPNVTVAALGGGSPPLPTPNLTGLVGTAVIPEPSTIALGILGAAALLLRRRK
jgi:hypothetical protein